MSAESVSIEYVSFVYTGQYKALLVALPLATLKLLSVHWEVKLVIEVALIPVHDLTLFIAVLQVRVAVPELDSDLKSANALKTLVSFLT
jgi:hypothetical protein